MLVRGNRAFVIVSEIVGSTTTITGKRRSLLMTEDNDKVFMSDKKPQRHAEDITAAFNCTPW